MSVRTTEEQQKLVNKLNSALESLHTTIDYHSYRPAAGEEVKDGAHFVIRTSYGEFSLRVVGDKAVCTRARNSKQYRDFLILCISCKMLEHQIQEAFLKLIQERKPAQKA